MPAVFEFFKMAGGAEGLVALFSALKGGLAAGSNVALSPTLVLLPLLLAKVQFSAITRTSSVAGLHIATTSKEGDLQESPPFVAFITSSFSDTDVSIARSV